MLRKARDFAIGLALGLLREFFVVQYLQAVQQSRAVSGMGLTLGIGCFDLFVIAKMMWQRNLWMAAGYVAGESLGTWISISMGKP